MKERELILWASFIHDLGKLVQRNEYLKTNETSHTQALKILLKGLKEKNYKWFQDMFEEDFKNLVLLSYYHHDRDIETAKGGDLKDQKLYELAKIISYADSLSSYEREIDEDKAEIWNKKLVSIFSRIKLDCSQKEENLKYLPIIPLQDNINELMPVEFNEKKGDYVSLTEKLIQELKRYFTAKEKEKDFSTFYSILEKHLWCIPSAYFRTIPDISLFQHLKSTAAIALILYEEYKNSGNINFLKERENEIFALVGFDISGIQDFIYTITSKKASKSLKGRSFYLQMLELAISEYILDELKYPYVNLLYSGGGKGFFIVHRSKIKELEIIKKHINEFLIENVDTKLFVNIDSIMFSPNDLKNFSPIFRNLIEKLSFGKSRKYSQLLKRKYSLFFAPPKEIPLYKCSVCGRDLKEGEFKEEEDNLRICKTCELFIKIGSKLRNSVGIGILKKNSSNFCFSFGDKEFCFDFLKKSYNEEELLKFKKLFLFEFSKKIIKKGIEQFYLPIGGNYVPLDENNQIKEFDSIAESSKGIKRLGVVRGDVDNLGLIFSKGLCEKNTFSRISQLSYMLRLFFSLGANNVFKADNDEYIVYSGGDDFFVIGRWDNLIEDVSEFRKKFKKFTCENPVFSFSCGFEMFRGKYPSFKFAEITGEAEEKAKRNKIENEKEVILKEKDSISFLGIEAFWDDFFVLKKIKENLEKLYTENKISKGYIRHLLKMYYFHKFKGSINEISSLKVKNKTEKLKWLHLYYIARMIERTKDSRKKEVKDDLEKIKTMLFDGKYENYEFISKDTITLSGIFSRWLELLIRE